MVDGKGELSASTTATTTTTTTTDQSQDKTNQDIIWKQILNEVSNQNQRRISGSKSLLVLGDNTSGKSSLIAKLQSAGGRETSDFKKSVSLQYTYIDVHNEDEKIRLGTWILDGDPYFDNLLQHVVTEESVHNLTVLLCADMSKPWHLINTLEHWAHKVHQHITALQLTAKQRNEMERAVQTKFDKYYKDLEVGGLVGVGSGGGVVGVDVAPQQSAEETAVEATGEAAATSTAEDESGASTPQQTAALGPNMGIPNNMGIPLIVVVTKTDSIESLEKTCDYREEHFDMVQKHVRRFALRHGAAVVYTSSKEGTNIQLLYRYLSHQLYGITPTNTTKGSMEPQLVDKYSVFVPCGWDNASKIAIIDEHARGASGENGESENAHASYNDFIPRPLPARNPLAHGAEKEVSAEDEQLFLEAQQNILNKMPLTSATSVNSGNNSNNNSLLSSLPYQASEHRGAAANMGGGMGQRSGVRFGAPAGSKGKGENGSGSGADGGSSETVLANFFNSLLNKTTTGKTPAKPTSSTNGTQGESAVKRP